MPKYTIRSEATKDGDGYDAVREFVFFTDGFLPDLLNNLCVFLRIDGYNYVNNLEAFKDDGESTSSEYPF